MLLHHQQVWGITLKRHDIVQFHSHTPLWLNGHMPELRTIYGVIYLYQVMTASEPKTFQSLKDVFSLANHLLFRYLQLHHALRTQFTKLVASLDTPCPEYYFVFGTF